MAVIPKPWQNRIIGSGTEAPDQLLANPLNWRTHPEAQQKALSGVLDEVGWVQQIVVNQRTGNMIDGHLRVTLALRRDEPTVPVLYVDLSAEEEALILATLDPIGALARADTGKLDELLKDIATGEPAVQDMLSKLAADEGLYKVDPMAEWQGMPAYENEDLSAYQSIRIHFRSQEHVQAFAELIQQPLTENTRAIWYPKAEQIDMSSEAYRDES